MFFKLYFHFNAFSAENRRLFSIEFQLHTNTHITLWLTVVPTLDRHSCVARASEMAISKIGNGESRNGERGTGNGERGTGNGERGTGNGEWGTENL